MHAKIAEDWVLKNYSNADEFAKVTDLMIEAGRMFDEWGLGQSTSLDLDTMIDALTLIQTQPRVYFQQ